MVEGDMAGDWLKWWTYQTLTCGVFVDQLYGATWSRHGVPHGTLSWQGVGIGQDTIAIYQHILI
jgi:hypothetical protein